MIPRTLAALALSASLAGCGAQAGPMAATRPAGQATAASYANPGGSGCQTAGNHTYDPNAPRPCVTPPGHHFTP